MKVFESRRGRSRDDDEDDLISIGRIAQLNGSSASDALGPRSRRNIAFASMCV